MPAETGHEVPLPDEIRLQTRRADGDAPEFGQRVAASPLGIVVARVRKD